jgi:hypothetical protein
MVGYRRGGLGGVVACALLASAVLGLVFPHDLAGVAGWSIVVLAVLWGLGGAVRRALDISVGMGEQMLLGGIVWLLTSGLLLAVGQASRVPLSVILAAGGALTLVELRDRFRAPAAPRDDDRTIALVLGGLLAAYLAFLLLAAAGGRGNPYDDQAAYAGFLKRLLDCGDLDEPFSFRRLSAYGGQAVLQALTALRGDVASFDLVDSGTFHVVSVLCVIDLARRRGLHLVVTSVIVLFLLTLWDLRINSAATWTGFSCFLGAYSFAARDDLSPRVALSLACAACAAACTLRQNYLAPGVLFAALLVLDHLRCAARASSWRAAWRAERTTAVIAVACAAVVVLPYAIAAWRSSGTALYPIVLGNGNPAAPLRPTAATWIDEAQFFVTVVFNPDPIRVWWLLALGMMLARDTGRLRAWYAMVIACGLGFALLVHSFMLSDANNLWRYAFGYTTALAIAFLVELAARLPYLEAPRPPRLRLPAVATFLVIVAILAHFVAARSVIPVYINAAADNLAALAELGTQKYDPRARHYIPLQEAIPRGASVAVLVDDPWLFDYDRNRIFNLDLPGFVAPPPGLPSFTDADHWRAYFTSRGIRYLAFNEEGYSTYLYRRNNWAWRMFSDDELWRFMGAHMVDTIDMLAELARRSRVLFHEEGLYAIDLGAEMTQERDRGEGEIARLDRYTREISESELHSNAWQLAPRANVVFTQDGLGPSPVVPWPGYAAELKDGLLSRLLGTVPEAPHRWLTDRTHLRLKASGRARVHMKIVVREGRLQTRPTFSLVIDGELIGRAMPGDDGVLVIDGEARCTGWCDAYILSSAGADWWVPADGLRVAKLVELEWNDAR